MNINVHVINYFLYDEIKMPPMKSQHHSNQELLIQTTQSVTKFVKKIDPYNIART